MPVSGSFAALPFLSLPGSCVSGPSGGVGKHGLHLAFPEFVFFQSQLIELTAHLPLQGPLTQLQLLQLFFYVFIQIPSTITFKGGLIRFHTSFI